ncbi:MAG: hypothetical protein ABSG21_15185 [Spirochaetia bacterium]
MLIDPRLLDACALLLGSSTRRLNAAVLLQLDAATVRRAWRVLAVSSHPDAARRGVARSGTYDGRRFIEASRAYELLMGYLLSRPAPLSPGARPSRPRAGHAASYGTAEKRAAGERWSATEKRGGALYYRGPVPRRRLRLAEFLYYSGRVSWQSLISAVVWQRNAQPRFGELARELRSISSQDLAQILASRQRHEQTGETAQRLRLLTGAQVDRILRMQRARRRLIGRYFMEKESMTSAMLVSILHELYRHNARWGRLR